MDEYDITRLIKALQNDPATNPDDLLQIEWAYLPLLDHRQGAYPKLLEEQLAGDPPFFCEVIRAVFRSKTDKPPAEGSTERQKKMARHAYQLLHRWTIPPGTQKDGSFDGEVFDTWLGCVKAECAASGHLKIAMTMVGHVLIHTPKDPSGLWIHRSVAVALNAKDAKDMRDGFTMALFNSRGVHGFTAGREEQQLAENYKKQADEVETHGYHRLANSLRELSSGYERDADREATRDPFED